MLPQIFLRKKNLKNTLFDAAQIPTTIAVEKIMLQSFLSILDLKHLRSHDKPINDLKI